PVSPYGISSMKHLPTQSMINLKHHDYKEQPLPLTIMGGIVLLILMAIIQPQYIGEALLLVVLCIVQNTAFSIVSRSRNRDNQLYHVGAAVMSNGVYLLTFKYMFDLGFEAYLFLP